MKKVLLVLVALTFSSVASAFLVGKVDVKKVLENVAEGAKVKKQLQAILTKKQGQLKSEEEKIRKMQTDFQKQSLVMNDKAKMKKQRDIQGKMMELQQKTVSFQKELHNKEKTMMGPLLKKLNEVIVATSKKEGVDFTVEVRSTPIVYAKKEKDLTPIVIKAYNKKHPGK